jgi:hypothetical protein
MAPKEYWKDVWRRSRTEAGEWTRQRMGDPMGVIVLAVGSGATLAWLAPGDLSSLIWGVIGALGSIAILYLWRVVMGLYAIPARIDAENSQALAAEKQRLVTLVDDYAYCLSLQTVHQEERRTGTPEAVTARQMRFLVKLNSISRPVRYEVRALEIDGIPQIDPHSRGTVLAALAETTYFSHFLDLPVESMGQVYKAILSLEIAYGPPHTFTRRMRKKVELELLPSALYLNMIYMKDEDDPIEPTDREE